MPNPSISEALSSFLSTVPVNFAQDITSRYSLEMECQINVSPEDGEPVFEGTKRINNTWSCNSPDCGSYKFYHIRVPKQAMSEPYFDDRPIPYPLARHMECVGLTGWNWTKRKSIWVAFDIDSITGHAAGVGVTDEDLAEVRKRASEIPWLQVRRSTGGAGIHLYAYFDPDELPDTENHTVHSAVARCVLGLMEREAGFDFRGNMDVYGGNMWVWHRKITPDNRGLEIIKDFEDFVPKLPDNWRDNIEVVGGKRSKVQVRGVNADEYDSFDKQASARVKVRIDETHKQIEERIEAMGFSIIWIPDHHCWQTHVKAFQELHEEFPGEYLGIFKTLSQGKDPGKPNCLAGNTKVITRKGLVPIRELAGKDAEIITSRGKWVSAPFKSYGRQPVFAITLQHGEDTKVIKATGDHRWFVCKRKWNGKRKLNLGDRSELTTSELKKDQVLVTLQPQLSVTPSVVGIQHGLVWGDGTNSGSRITSQLPLFGEKDSQMLKFFREHPTRPIERSIGGTEVLNLPYHFKSLVPLHYDKPYLYGWLAGYFAADGCVAENGTCCINSSSLESLHHVQNICVILGIRTSPIREMSVSDSKYLSDAPGYKLGINRGDLTEDFFLISSHKERAMQVSRHNNRYWRVVSIEPAGTEEVFCCTVEDTHCFVLEDFIFTGNCFAFPMTGGGMRVTKFGKGAKEHETWHQDGNDWTWTYFNRAPSLREAASIYGGVEDPDGKGWIFTELKDVVSAVQSLGDELPLDEAWMQQNGETKRNILLRPNKQNQLVIEMDKLKDEKTPKGWIEKGKKCIKLIRGANTNPAQNEEETNLDDRVRAVVDTNNEFSQWVLLNEDGEWVSQPKDNIRSALKVWNPDNGEEIIGKLVIQNWKLVNVPFQPEYLGNRRWNKHAPQLTVSPAEAGTPHPHWDIILDHCGQDLDDVLKTNNWCRENGIVTGADYLSYWLSFTIRDPYCKLPYLFLYGPQNSGKSILHEAASLLMTRGVQLADEALKNAGNFNGELAGAVLCVVEECNLSSVNTLAYNRMKAWVTGEDILIHPKKQQPYMLRNTTHWIQCANDKTYVPIFPGDTRIVIMYVPMIDSQEIPKDTLLSKLKDESSAFLRTLLDLKLPPPPGRMRLPVVMTDSKKEAERASIGLLDEFIEKTCHHIPGAITKFSDFYEAMSSWMPQDQRYIWTYTKVGDEFRTRDFLPLVFGRSQNNVSCIGNLSLTPKHPAEEYGAEWVRVKQRLNRKTQENL